MRLPLARGIADDVRRAVPRHGVEGAVNPYSAGRSSPQYRSRFVHALIPVCHVYTPHCRARLASLSCQRKRHGHFWRLEDSAAPAHSPARDAGAVFQRWRRRAALAPFGLPAASPPSSTVQLRAAGQTLLGRVVRGCTLASSCAAKTRGQRARPDRSLAPAVGARGRCSPGGQAGTTSGAAASGIGSSGGQRAARPAPADRPNALELIDERRSVRAGYRSASGEASGEAGGPAVGITTGDRTEGRCDCHGRGASRSMCAMLMG